MEPPAPSPLWAAARSQPPHLQLFHHNCQCLSPLILPHETPTACIPPSSPNRHPLSTLIILSHQRLHHEAPPASLPTYGTFPLAHSYPLSPLTVLSHGTSSAFPTIGTRLL